MNQTPETRTKATNVFKCTRTMYSELLLYQLIKTSKKKKKKITNEKYFRESEVSV